MKITKDFEKQVRAVRMQFLDQVEPWRADLFRYCRGLTGSIWDAEDLVQETLLRAFAKLSELHWDVQNPRAWLFVVATNVWRDRLRKDEPAALPEAWDVAAPEEAARPEVREALLELARSLPPRERAALLMKDVFDLSLEETASALGMTVGAVKSALHRARGALDDRAPEKVLGARTVSDELLDRFVTLFDARDLAGLAALFHEDATANVLGMVEEHGREQIEKGSLHHTIFDEAGDPRARRAVYRGEPVVILRYEKEGARAVEDVLRFVEKGGRLASLVYYYFCPEVLESVAHELGEPVRTNGHRYR
ncbi:MAG TPA: sigma-70 family RNA polymerase sigma factor [Planctomycetota bacterium]|nr:sigma-70 family RNA polymerase sigma factor [Planctomycetota bacterium]